MNLETESDEEIEVEETIASRRKQLFALFYIFLSALLYGISFGYQRYAMLRGIGPITFNACRFPISTVLTIFAQFGLSSKAEALPADSSIRNSYYKVFETLKWGMFCGFFVFGGSVLQQIGLKTVQAAKMSFITGSYVIFVPIVEWFLPGFGLSLNWRVWLSAAVSVIGMLLLSGCVGEVSCFKYTGDIFMNGEMIIFISMLFWVVVLMATDVASKKVDCLSLAIVEDLVCSILTIIAALTLEHDMWIAPYSFIRESWDLILIVAIVEGAAVVFGILGQIYVSPSLTALISSTASVYTAIGGYLFLHEVLSIIELLGCGLILMATILVSCQMSENSQALGDKIVHDKVIYDSI
jgi:drug/metabolite transporter (DMT)-like permease